jgi:hypothetical protein
MASRSNTHFFKVIHDVVLNHPEWRFERGEGSRYGWMIVSPSADLFDAGAKVEIDLKSGQADIDFNVRGTSACLFVVECWSALHNCMTTIAYHINQAIRAEKEEDEREEAEELERQDAHRAWVEGRELARLDSVMHGEV